MCLNTENFRCCCGCCSLTTATWVVGALVAFDMVCAFIFGFYLSGACEALLVVPFLLTLFDKHKVLYRKILYIVFLIGTIVGVVSAAIIITVVAVNPEQMQEQLRDQCLSDETLLDYFNGDVNECEDTMHSWILSVVVLACLIGIPINLLITRMFYYAWKEQVEHHRRLAANAFGQQQNHAHMVQPATAQVVAPQT